MKGQHAQNISFDDICKTELDVISAGRAKTDKPPQALIGLAFSGGGIRSATFNLGVLQALAETKSLQCFDYLSTVSGGGYIGSWFSTLLQRKAAANHPDPSPQDIASALVELQNELTPEEQDKHSRLNIQASSPRKDGPSGQKALLWLRRYSAYLTPRYGLFRLDTLAALAGLFRNLLLNQAILIYVLMAMLLLPYGLMNVGHELATTSLPYTFKTMAVLTCLLLGLAIYNVGWGLNNDYTKAGHASDTSFRKISSGLIEGDVWTIAISAFLGTTLAALLFYLDMKLGWKAMREMSFAVGLIYLLAFVPTQLKDLKSAFWTLLTAVSLGAMCYGYGSLLPLIHAELRGAFTLILGPTILIQLLCMAAIIQTGLTGRGYTESNREWLGRAGGMVFALEMMWVVFTALALLAPALIDYMNDWVAYSGGVAWALGTVATFWLAKSNQSGSEKSSPLVETGLSVAPYLIMLGLLIVLSNGLHNALYKFSVPADQRPAAALSTPHHDFTIAIKNNQFDRFEAAPPDAKPTLLHSVQNTLQENGRISLCTLIIALFGFVSIGALLAFRVDINLFSMHQFYRNRLARAYLGASNTERNDRDPFTDFAQSDDIALSELKAQRPIHLVNTTLNLTKIKENELAWQERLGVAFLFSPQYCGYQLSPHDPRYVRTKEYMKTKSCPAGVMLGTAVAVSGAAASPNMGYHSSPPLAFLMTLFNVRLGRWCPNTAKGDTRQSGPKFGLWCLLKELLGSADDDYDFVNLTDGGHFENLGIYELVRRQCKVIIVSDGGADDMNGFTYEDLGNAIQKCRVDFGANIEMFGMDEMRPRKATSRFACGRICYADESTGVLIYLKPLLCGNEPVDVSHYAAMHKDFPHQSTGDQWFEESQFESYRRLGILTAKEMIERYGISSLKQQCDNDCDAYALALYQHLNENFLIHKRTPSVTEKEKAS